ncbi:MAG: carboxypeptidase-like regulatory domain-containing protein [Nitrososphaerales archaeon]
MNGPIEGAKVTVEDVAKRSQMTMVGIGNLAPGEHKVTASKDGYDPASKTIKLEADKEVTVDLSLKKSTGSISGKVTDSKSKKPIVGAGVSAGGKSVKTNDKGYYSIDGLKEGNYDVEAGAEGYITSSISPIIGIILIISSITMVKVSYSLTVIFRGIAFKVLREECNF